MRIHLEQLPHQEEAIAAVLKALSYKLDASRSNDDPEDLYANPRLKPMGGIDVKMETGTGKTYVYTRLMHELYRDFGLNKFVILTPSIAIKEGTRNFIDSDYATQHFRELFPDQKISLGVINAGDFQSRKGKRRQFAPSLSDFVEASVNDVGTVNVLLLNDGMLGSSSMTRDDYDQTLLGGLTKPTEAIAATRPIVIIDEPHRFHKEKAAWKHIQSLDPQLIIRFGATFPTVTSGRGRNKVAKPDYDNLVYDLNAVESFNQNLVKGVDVTYPDLPEALAKNRYRVKSVTSKTLTLRQDANEWTLQVGDQLASIDPAFEGGVTYQGSKTLSNDLDVAEGMWLIPGTWTNSYQELMIGQAINAHFEKERALFYRVGNAPKVKVLSLFFIDSIASYRDENGWLKLTFERLLSEKLKGLIAAEQGEYKEFLEATLAALHSEDQQVHAGYFAEDTAGGTDEAIRAEVDDILRNKEKLLQFKDERGNWNTRRFLFSKWTLREGWDNPNVFVLAKLRTSGSEISKIQEVGRGLRLPVDEQGNRLSNEEFRLTFLIDYSEREFAQKLIKEVNSDGGGLAGGKITMSVLEQIVDAGHAADVNKAKAMLLFNDIIDADDNVIDADALNNLIPGGVNPGKIRDKGSPKPVVRLRKHNWERIRSLWKQASRRYMVSYQRLSNDELAELVAASITRESFSDSFNYVTTERTYFDKASGSLQLREQQAFAPSELGVMEYGAFLKALSKSTNLQINLLHRAVVSALDGVAEPGTYFNERTLHLLRDSFESEFMKRFSERYEYKPLDFSAQLNIFDDKGDFKAEIAQGLVGNKLATDVDVADRYLYEEAAYDSAIEHQVLKQKPHDEVLVFGKLPRRSIRIPTYLGKTTTPDFVYAVMATDGSVSRLYALIETKDKKDGDYFAEEKVAIEAQKLLGEHFENIEIRLVNDVRQVEEILEVLANNS